MMILQYYISFIHSSIDGHLGYFYLLIIMNNTVVNILVQILYKHVFSSLEYIPRSRIAGSYGNSVSNFLKNC